VGRYGLGTITDFVQQASGPVDLDRSLVELTVTALPCRYVRPARGRRFKFPADLDDAGTACARRTGKWRAR
jgi:hypothetical protein